MKTIKILLLAFVLTFALASSCEPEEQQAEVQCDCIKTYYMRYPAMGTGASYVPEHYDVVSSQPGKFDCDEDTGTYTPVNTSSQYTHYKINCD